jgi:hypothetical protein
LIVFDFFTTGNVEQIEYNGVVQALSTNLTGSSGFVEYVGSNLVNGTLYYGTTAGDSQAGSSLRDFLAGAGGNGKPAHVLLQDGGIPVRGAMDALNDDQWLQFEQQFLHVNQ